MSDRVCIRGCVQADVHYATCAYSGREYTSSFPCRGCAPRECREGSLICDRCFGRARALLNDAPDLLARLRSIGDPSKATPTDQVRVRGQQTEMPAPIGADLLDAIRTVENVVAWWFDCGQDLPPASNDRYSVEWLSEMVLDRHPEEDGLRLAWSVQDAVDKWQVERHDKNPVSFEDEPEREVIVTPVPEWGDRLLTRQEAEIAAGSARTFRRWVRDEKIVPEGRMIIGGVVTQWYRYSEIKRVREAMRAKREQSQFKAPDED